MSFFYNLNKTLDSIREKPELTHKQLNERNMSRAAKGYEKYGKEGMEALAKAGREGKSLDPIRAKFDKYDEGAYQAGPDKSQIPAVNRPGNKMTLQDLEKERNQSPTTPDGMRALQNKLKNIHPMDFAGKIAGAKKEVDEMLGDVAAEAIKGALSGKQKKLDKNDNGKLDAQDFAMLRKGGKQKTTEDDKEDLNPFTNYKKPRKDTPRVGDTEHGSKHDIKHTSTGRMVTRRADAQGMSIGSETDDEGNQHEKRGRGRPKGAPKAPERVTSKATKHKDGRKVKEGDFGPMEEGAVSTGNLQKMHQLIAGLKMYINDAEGQALLKELSGLVKHYLGQGIGEEKTTTRDDRAEKAGKRVAKDIEYDEKKKDGIHGKKRGAEDDKAEKAGKKVAKDIEYDEKKDKKEDKPKKVKEAGGTDTPTASSGFSYGKGIYDSINHEIEKMIAESMNISMNSSTEGDKSLTITATEEDAVKLSMLLNTAGLGGDSEGYGGSGYKSACGCGTPDCSCGDQEMDEAAPTVSDNEPDWPTNTEEGDALQYSGGLDGPKSTGQSTVPVLASQDDRQHSYTEEDALRRMMEMAGIKEAAKPDFLDMDKDGDKKEPMKKAVDDKEKKVEESIFTLTNQWKAYKG